MARRSRRSAPRAPCEALSSADAESPSAIVAEVRSLAQAHRLKDSARGRNAGKSLLRCGEQGRDAPALGSLHAEYAHEEAQPIRAFACADDELERQMQEPDILV